MCEQLNPSNNGKQLENKSSFRKQQNGQNKRVFLKREKYPPSHLLNFKIFRHSATTLCALNTHTIAQTSGHYRNKHFMRIPV